MNTNNINFNELWSAQKAEPPTTKDLLFKLKNFKRENRNKIIISNVILIFSSLFMVFCWLYYHPKLITSKIGILLIILACIIFVISMNKSLEPLKKIDESESNQQYLKALLILKEKQHFMQTTMLNLYFILLSTGIALHMYEYTSRMSIIWAFFAYGITALWILFNWFYLRPKQIKKEQIKLNEIISKVEKLYMQLD